MTYLAQFFTYIPILGSVPSFETQKLNKWLNSKILNFCVEVDRKSKFSSQTCLAQFFSRLGNCQSDPLLQSTNNIHLVWIPSRLSSRLHQGFPFKEQMNSHKYVLNLKLHWVASSIYHSRLVPISLPPTIPIQCLPFSPKILIHHSYLTYPSTILHFLAINRRFGFIETYQEKHTKS